MPAQPPRADVTRAPLAAVAIVTVVVMVAAIATAAPMASFVATVLTDRGESVPGASVTLRSTSNTYTATSDASGRVAIANVVPDTYTAVVRVPFFDTLTVEGIALSADASHTV